MSFLHPAALLLGAGLVGVPLVVHLLTRPRPVRLPFSAMRFLESVLRQRRFFARLRDALVLGMRALLLVALACAFARPLVQGPAASAAGDVVRRIIVLDVSRSMDARRGGVRVFDRAQAQALRYIGRDGALTDVILAGATPRAAFDILSANRPALEGEVRRAEVREEELDARAALALAGRLLIASPAGGKAQVVIVTDLQQTNWATATGAALPADAEVTVEYVGLGAEVGNLAVTDVSTVGRLEAGQPVEVQVQVRNFSVASQLRAVQLTANGRTYRQEVRCPAGEAATASFDLPAEVTAGEAEGGYVTGSAHLIEARDALPADDVRFFAFRVGRAPVVALISREDSLRVGTLSYLLSRLLCPTPARSGARVVPVKWDAVTASSVAEANMVVLNKPGRLDQAALEVLGGLLLRGRPFLWIASEPADAEDLAGLKNYCGDALRLPVRFAASDSGGATGSRGRAGGPPTGNLLTLTDVRSAQEPFAGFGDSVGELARTLTTSSALPTALEPQGAADDVLARWSDGSAALIWTRVGNGTLVVVNSDLQRSSLARSPFFVALVREMSLALLADRFGIEGAVPVGMPCVMALPPEADSVGDLALIGPDGTAMGDLRVEREATGAAWRWASAGVPGVYRIAGGGRTIFAAATVCPAAESDLRAADAQGLQERLLTERAGAGQSPPVAVLGLTGGPQRADILELWPWLVVAGVVLVIAELGLLKLFRV